MKVDDAHDIDIVMSMHNLMEYSYNYSKASGILWQYFEDEPAINVANGDIADFNAANATANSFKVKDGMQTGNNRCWNNGTIKISKYSLETS